MRNAAAGLPPPIATSSLNFVSRPIHRNAMVNHQPLNPAVIPVTALALASLMKKENTIEAIINPTTNFGNLNHISMRLGFSPAACPLNVNQIARKKAAKPMSTFCAIFTTTATAMAASPAIAPAATTAPVVSIVPPIQAPATAGSIPTALAIRGWNNNIGIAQRRTSEIVWLIFFWSPFTAPPAAIAAETPQIDTAVPRIDANSSSSPSFLATQKQT